MELFCFASKSLTNIWAGIGARMWAVAETSESDMKARITKSKRMKVGSLGVLYCNETHSFTTPFLVYSMPNPESVVADIWPMEASFRIHPPHPSRRAHMDVAKKFFHLEKQRCGERNRAMTSQEQPIFMDISADDCGNHQ
jgi:hypothetical protein